MDTTHLSSVTNGAISSKTRGTTSGLTAMMTTSERCVTSALPPRMTDTSGMSSCSFSSKAPEMSAALRRSADTTPADTTPRMREPAMLPAPMKPKVPSIVPLASGSLRSAGCCELGNGVSKRSP
eukprot:scaffold1227_cov256-Pinguiococcus_pyrenoidosus.AAC.8